MRYWGDKPYYSFSHYLKQTFGEKIHKVSINAGMSCPNRDGKIGRGGCIFCSTGGSGDFAGNVNNSITEQINQGIAGTTKFNANKYIAYFQAFTNTYAPIDYLTKIYEEAIAHEKISVVSIATRPDCLSDEVIDLIARLNKKKPVWVELGLQTIHEDTAEYIRRGYPLDCFHQSVKKLREKGITVIVHVIIGLPGEDKKKVLETIEYLNTMDIQGIKLQLLHVLEYTDMAKDYKAGKFEVLSLEEYTDYVVSCIANLNPNIVIHRITGDGPKDILIAPLWSSRKMFVMNTIHHELKVRNIWQGCQWNRTNRIDEMDK